MTGLLLYSAVLLILRPIHAGFASVAPTHRAMDIHSLDVAMQIGNKRVNRRKRGAQVAERRKEMYESDGMTPVFLVPQQ